jgi:hypothetical protein
MAELLYDPLEDEIEFRIQPERNLLVRGFRPWLVRTGAPAGTIRLELRDTSGQLIAASDAMDAADVGEGDHWTGDQGFLLEAALQSGVTYVLALVGGGGYAHADAAHVGWCLDYAESRKVRLGYTEAGHDQSPYGLELWTVQEKTRGVRYGY